MNEFEEFDDIEDEEYETIMITDDSGSEIEFIILDSVEHNNTTYVLGVESDKTEDDEVEAYIFKVVAEEGDNIVYEELEDGEEFNKVSSLFQNNEEYDLEL